MNFRIAFASILLAASGLAFAAKPSPPDLLIVPAAKGGDKIEISFDDKHVYITSGSFDVTGQSSKGARYYRSGAAGEAMWEVKDSTDHSFKVKDAAAKLLWKVKYDNDDVTIADNEDMSNARSIKLHADHIKASGAKNAQLGEARANKDSGKVKVKDAHGKELYVVEIGKLTAACGVLLMKDIPEQQRLMLAAEVFVHGK